MPPGVYDITGYSFGRGCSAEREARLRSGCAFAMAPVPGMPSSGAPATAPSGGSSGGGAGVCAAQPNGEDPVAGLEDLVCSMMNTGGRVRGQDQWLGVYLMGLAHCSTW
jgi:hypothetical protein